jgi:hypothetical protein
MEEKISAQKAKKNNKEEEPVFTGMKLKKSKQLQRQWTEPELETVKLKDHQFEQLAQIETEELNCSAILTKKEKKLPVPKTPKRAKSPKPKVIISMFFSI